MTDKSYRTDNLSEADRKRTMRSVRSTDTSPEMTVRRLLHSMGYRYRLHDKNLPGRPDIVFSGRKKVIFVHGCFWHGHECKAGHKIPKTNSEYWIAKLTRNKERDMRNQSLLTDLGWWILVVWECETRDVESLKQMLRSFLDGYDGD